MATCISRVWKLGRLLALPGGGASNPGDGHQGSHSSSNGNRHQPSHAGRNGDCHAATFRHIRWRVHTDARSRRDGDGQDGDGHGNVRANAQPDAGNGNLPAGAAQGVAVAMETLLEPERSQADGTFVYRTRVRFHQADPAGVLFVGRLFELISDAYEEFVEAAGLRFDAVGSLGGMTTPIVRVEADYRQAVRIGEVVVVRLRLERLGESSLTYSFQLLGPEGNVRTTGRVVHAFVRLPDFAKIAMPGHVRQAFEALAARYGMNLGAGPPPG